MVQQFLASNEASEMLRCALHDRCNAQRFPTSMNGKAPLPTLAAGLFYELTKQLPLNQAARRPLISHAGRLAGQHVIEYLLQVVLLHTAGYLWVIVDSPAIAHRKAAAAWLQHHGLGGFANAQGGAGGAIVVGEGG